jgi:hypothetical protein
MLQKCSAGGETWRRRTAQCRWERAIPEGRITHLAARLKKDMQYHNRGNVSKRVKTHLAEVGEELAAYNELEHKIESDVVLKRGEEIHDEGMLQGVSQVLRFATACRC